MLLLFFTKRILHANVRVVGENDDNTFIVMDRPSTSPREDEMYSGHWRKRRRRGGQGLKATSHSPLVENTGQSPIPARALATALTWMASSSCRSAADDPKVWPPILWLSGLRSTDKQSEVVGGGVGRDD